MSLLDHMLYLHYKSMFISINTCCLLLSSLFDGQPANRKDPPTHLRYK